MNEKTAKIVFWISTGLFSVVMAMSAGIYFFAHHIPLEAFAKLGFPTWLIYPLGTAKVLGLIAIWVRKSVTLREWAYAGFVFNTLMAAYAHIHIGDGESIPAIVMFVLVLVSYFSSKKAFAESV